MSANARTPATGSNSGTERLRPPAPFASDSPCCANPAPFSIVPGWSRLRASTKGGSVAFETAAIVRIYGEIDRKVNAEPARRIDVAQFLRPTA